MAYTIVMSTLEHLLKSVFNLTQIFQEEYRNLSKYYPCLVLNPV